MASDTKEALDAVERIAAALLMLREELEAVPAQVGDRNFFDRSVGLMEREAEALATHLRTMLDDPTKR